MTVLGVTRGHFENDEMKVHRTSCRLGDATRVVRLLVIAVAGRLLLVDAFGKEERSRFEDLSCVWECRCKEEHAGCRSR